MLDRQGWVGDTLWDARETQLSWDVTSSYQPRNQWPEPASFSFIDNSILEFAPSGAYVEDWRQQAGRGRLLGLRLHEALNEANGEVLPLDGGLIHAGEHVAFARSRFPGPERVLQNSGSLARALIEQALTSREIESYEVSVALAGDLVTCSTQSWRLGQPIVSGEFALEHVGSVSLRQCIDGVPFSLRFSLDLHLRDCNFDAPTMSTPEAAEWMQHESEHLTRNAFVVR